MVTSVMRVAVHTRPGSSRELTEGRKNIFQKVDEQTSGLTQRRTRMTTSNLCSEKKIRVKEMKGLLTTSQVPAYIGIIVQVSAAPPYIMSFSPFQRESQKQKPVNRRQKPQPSFFFVFGDIDGRKKKPRAGPLTSRTPGLLHKPQR